MKREASRAAVWRAAMFISLLAVADPALAAEVSGRVTLDNQPFVGMLKLPDGSEVQITNGEFRIFVPAGEYQVKFETGGRSIPATIQSSTLPVSQDINLVSQR